jgi:hypothetical protein
MNPCIIFLTLILSLVDSHVLRCGGDIDFLVERAEPILYADMLPSLAFNYTVSRKPACLLQTTRITWGANLVTEDTQTICGAGSQQSFKRILMPPEGFWGRLRVGVDMREITGRERLCLLYTTFLPGTKRNDDTWSLWNLLYSE